MRTTYLTVLLGILLIATGCPSEEPQDDDTATLDDDDSNSEIGIGTRRLGSVARFSSEAAPVEVSTQWRETTT